MKRIILTLFAFSLLFTGCEDIADNSPAMQGEINDVFFKAININGQPNADGTFTIQGENQDEKLTFVLSGVNPGAYLLGPDEPNTAGYEDANGTIFTTAEEGEGRLVIENHCESCGEISGRFNFVAIKPGVDTIYMQKGYFYQVPYLFGEVDDGLSDGFMNATINGEAMQTEELSANETGGQIVLNGFFEHKNITIKVPVNAESGSYSIGTPGFSASVTLNNMVEVAETGTITVNFINTDLRRGKVFFQFNTTTNEVTNGDTEFDY